MNALLYTSIYQAVLDARHVLVILPELSWTLRVILAWNAITSTDNATAKLVEVVELVRNAKICTGATH